MNVVFARYLRKLAFGGLAVVLLVIAAALVITWVHFHPRDATPVIGPKGKVNRAFIENRSFHDLCFVLCVSDWPHTFAKPASIGSVIYSELEDGRVFWSVDGSVVVVRHGSDFLYWRYSAAYDFESHQLLSFDADHISTLIEARGGLGPEQQQYPDGKDCY